MSKPIADVTENASNLKLTMDAHKDEMVAKGFKEVRLQNFADLMDSVTRKISLQKAAQDTMMANTESQNIAIQQARTVIRKIQNAGKAKFGLNKTKQKEFKIGANTSNGVGKTAELLDYLAAVCTKYHDDLIESGLTEEDFAAITPTYANLVTADSIQEHSKKLRNVATDARDAAVTALEEEMFKIRSFVKAAFANNKALLEEFKPIKKGGRKSSPETPAPTPSPAPQP